ncbi:hypothetical protein Ana3638_23315 [Anaerocolumna sedimenticola]|uniref:Uncharacterized protein n=1 Tax=Anaerocolumna sedimenticola TaxID=2696063 RepID=A0A6P1TS97_9FIRM|nr:hypothetical protein [Anaerocolumna sedimenticola]QHQ63343.1 hypothetical protein Ana3638_23315 [Anaerocolumna sedimenticola]
MDEIDFDDIQHPVLQGILKYIESNVYLAEKSWSWTIPTNNDYAHAPWYTFETGNTEAYSELVTIGLVFFIIRHTEENSAIYKKAAALLEGVICKFSDSTTDFFTISSYCELVRKIEKYKLESRFDIKTVKERLPMAVNTYMERDPFKWDGCWCGRPSFFIKSPESVYYKGNEDSMSKELDWQLDKMTGRLTELNVWNVNANGWYWEHNNRGGEYPMESFISANCWEIIDAINNIRLFKNFGRMDFSC